MNKTNKGLGITEVLILILIVLKLTKLIKFSWWIVLCPVILNLGIKIFLLALILMIGALKNILKNIKNTNKEMV